MYFLMWNEIEFSPILLYIFYSKYIEPSDAVERKVYQPFGIKCIESIANLILCTVTANQSLPTNFSSSTLLIETPCLKALDFHTFIQFLYHNRVYGITGREAIFFDYFLY